MGNLVWFISSTAGDILFLQYRMAQIPAYLRAQGRGRGRGNSSSEKHSHSCPPGRIILSKNLDKLVYLLCININFERIWVFMEVYTFL